MHYKWGYLRPLLLQSILGLKTLFGAPIVRVWILGTAAEGELSRPWSAANPFGYLFLIRTEEKKTVKQVKQMEKKEEKKKISSKKTD